MPREVFADEIERFLEALDGVSSARVLSESSGDISYVYVTTEDASDTRGLRHGVVAALQSRFGIPIDPWRVRVTQLRAGVQPSEIPRFHVARVEETATTAELTVTVKLQWSRGADVRSATGQARGRGGAAYRARTIAAATVAAARDALGVPSGELALDRVGTATFLDRPVVLVALSAGGPGGTRTLLGAAFDDTTLAAVGSAPDEAIEPAITATLDAVARWLLEAAFVSEPSTSSGRHARLETMRRHVQDSAADSAADSGPIPLRGPHREDPGVAGPRNAAIHYAAASRTSPVHAFAPRRLAPVPEAQVAVDRPIHRTGKGDAAGPEIGPRAMGSRPQEETAMVPQHDRSDTPSAVRERTSTMEDEFYRPLVADRTPVHLRCRDGYEVPRAILREAGTYALLVETPDGLELFFKHAIISIRVLPKPAARA